MSLQIINDTPAVTDAQRGPPGPCSSPGPSGDCGPAGSPRPAVPTGPHGSPGSRGPSGSLGPRGPPAACLWLRTFWIMIIWMNVSSEFGFWKVSVTSFESFLYSPGCHHANIIVIQIIWNVFLLHRNFPKWRLKPTDLQYPISPALLCTCYYPLCVLLALEILCSSTKLTFALMLSECCVSLC